MHFATISFFELGQFLRIVLWIALPMVMISLLVTVYIHYSRTAIRKRGKGQEPSMEKPFGEEPFSGTPEKMSPAKAHDLEVVGETVYQGLLWMKNKYEQDREQSTAKYMQLKEEHGQLKEKYQELETRHLYTQELLNERQSTIDRLRGQLQQETLRTAEAKSKLESSGHLLLKIHRELDQVLAREAFSSETPKEENSEATSEDAREAAGRSIPEFPVYAERADQSEIPAHPETPIAEGTRIAAWVESEAIA